MATNSRAAAKASLRADSAICSPQNKEGLFFISISASTLPHPVQHYTDMLICGHLFMIWIRNGWQSFSLDLPISTEEKLSALLFH